ncbi:acyl-CoA N-acyltransferase [Apiospora rasikravindrae]|uniref:Acyl-CoA N-acyltransferase n=1 Tax=Apiospora rasikravindrae TaxID=990691 RepID=A0ABR1RP80_9PEZI
MPVSPPPGLEIRSAQPGDITSIVDLLASAPDDAALYQYPNLLDHPDALRPMHRAWVRELLQDPTSLTRIAVLDGNVVVGFSSWVRRAPNPDHPGILHRIKISEPLALDPEDGQDGSESPPSIEPDKTRAEAITRVRERLSHTSPFQSIPRYSLQGLAVHASHQGHGIGTLLVRWGLEQGAAEGVPVLTAGEARGVKLYTSKALGFQIVKGSEWWLDRDGQDITDQEAKEGGYSHWESIHGGVSGAQVVWAPPGLSLGIEGVIYRG